MDEALSVDEITPEAAVSLLARGAMLIDVREPEEWLLGRAPQAFHIPLGDLGSRLAELPRDRKLIMICRSGARSGRAAETLVESGLPAVNLAGGMQAWSAACLPVVADGGAPGEVA
jgi:rhodanese-related sulfurtransferase